MYLNIALIAALIIVYSAVSRRLERSPVSGAMVFTGFGLLFGPHVLGLLQLQVERETIRLLAELTLAIVLFLDAAHAHLDVIRKNVGLLVRLLLIGLPLTLAAGFGAGLLLFPGLAVVEVALLATMLAPTDAALGKPVVSHPSVPENVREGLNVESGLNDGICVPILLFFLAVARMPSLGEEAGRFLLELFVEEVGVGLIVGLVVVFVANGVLRFGTRCEWITETWLHLVSAAMAIACFASAQALGGSGLIASFVGGLLFGTLAKEQKEHLIHTGEVLGDTFTLLTWVIFGTAVVGLAMASLTWRTFAYALLSLTVVRMVPVLVALTGSRIDFTSRVFVGWFGPRGLASIVFAVMVANARLPGGEIITTAIAVTVILSVLAHGLTANPLVAAYLRHMKEKTA